MGCAAVIFFSVSLSDDLILMRASAHRLYFEIGGCAAAPFFLLLAQKKEGKEKGPLYRLIAALLAAHGAKRTRR